MIRIKEIINQCDFLENKIDEVFTNSGRGESQFDILIIEDDKPTIMVLNDYFELRGIKSKAVTSGTKGFEELYKFTPKLILLDIVLPDIDGYEICKKIKFDKCFEKINKVPVYFITAITESKVREKIEESGAKPFDFDEFEILFKYL